MPRTARAAVAGYCYHALNRGNGLARVFHDADDYHDFLRLLRLACRRVPMRLIGFSLMPNHFHLPRAWRQRLAEVLYTSRQQEVKE
jgi:putative transposase